MRMNDLLNLLVPSKKKQQTIKNPFEMLFGGEKVKKNRMQIDR